MQTMSLAQCEECVFTCAHRTTGSPVERAFVRESVVFGAGILAASSSASDLFSCVQFRHQLRSGYVNKATRSSRVTLVVASSGSPM